MTSRTPRDSRLRLVRPRALATARRAVSTRRTRPAPRPPEGTPPRTELARQARAVLADAVRIAHWAAGAPAPGCSAAPLATQALERAATALELSPAQVRAGWDRARLAGLIELHGDTARPGWRLRAWDRDDSAVLRGWVALFDAWSLVHAAPEGIEAGAVAEAVEAVYQVLSLLQLSAGPVPVPALLDLLAQRITELQEERCEVPSGAGRAGLESDPATTGRPVPAPERGADVDALLLDWALEGLAAVGALTLGQGHATLTPLGNWAVWAKLEQICVAAQSPAGNIEQSAADMLLGCARLTPGPARAEYRAWLAARTVGSAVNELLAVARGQDALLRGLAFEALQVVGAPAEPEVRAVLAEAFLRPYALLWLAEHEGVDPDDAQEILSREEATWLWVDTAAAVADHGETSLLVRHLDSAVQGTVPALLDEVRAVGHPRTVQVLVALAAAHPDPALAKAVRKAAFQVHAGIPSTSPARLTGGSAEPSAVPEGILGDEGIGLPAHSALPRCHAHLTLLDDDPRTGTPVRLSVELVAEPMHPWARSNARPPLDIVAVPLSGAEVTPATSLYGPGNADFPQFRLTAMEPGTHRIRFTFLHHTTGVVLQQVETDVDVVDADPAGAEETRAQTLRERS